MRCKLLHPCTQDSNEVSSSVHGWCGRISLIHSHTESCMFSSLPLRIAAACVFFNVM